MPIERTLSIVKPDGVGRNLIGEVYHRFEQAGLRVIAARMLHLSQTEAEGFYAVHRERPFFKDLVKFMTSGPVMVQVLEGEGAIAKNREVMGATDPKKAAPGTIRADLATSIDENIVHGSDAPDTAQLRTLTDREREVLALVGRGLNNEEIGRELYLSPLTAKTHVSRIMSKLAARDRVQLVVIAYETGLVKASWI